jgi:hypothetical protein
LRMNSPHLLMPGRFATLGSLLARCEQSEEFKATSFTEYAVPRAD